MLTVRCRSSRCISCLLISVGWVQFSAPNSLMLATGVVLAAAWRQSDPAALPSAPSSSTMAAEASGTATVKETPMAGRRMSDSGSVLLAVQAAMLAISSKQPRQ